MGEWEGSGGRQVGNQRWVKATIQTQKAVLYLQCVTQTDTIHKGGQDWCEEQPDNPHSPTNAPQDLEMHPCGFRASIKTVGKSKPGNLLPSTWCFWIVQECVYHVQAQDRFQFLCVNDQFSTIQSHLWKSHSHAK